MWTDRTELLLGKEGLASVASARAVVVGVGGVGAYAAEMLVRAGLGSILLIDSDTVSESNLNRQLPALRSTIGKSKCEVLRERFLDINPALDIEIISDYINEENVASVLDPQRADVILDCIDTLSPKVALVTYCLARRVRLVSAMGAGAKRDATAIRVDDISQTKLCPLAYMLRKRLHKMGIRTGFKAVYSLEAPDPDAMMLEESRNKRSQVGTISYMPAAFGCVMAQAAIAELLADIQR